jgi:N-acetylglutamate synthase-like GNAT family acetyltransferase
MNPTYRVRRATLDDIPALSVIWSSMRFPVPELSKQITEFQVAENQNGEIVGALGLQMVERQGRIHSEGFTDFSLADMLRPKLWERLQSVATNHGLLRFWTQENAPFWSHGGLDKADEETLAKLPAAWRGLPGPWWTLKLKEDLETLISADREFAVFMQAEKERTQRTFQQARLMKIIASLIALALLGIVVVFGVIFIKRSAQLKRRGDIHLIPPRVFLAKAG